VEIRALRDDSDFQALIKGPVQGVVVHSIVPDGPAARSDLRPTDIITAIDGKAVGTAQQLKSEVRGKKIGQSVTLDVFRQGKVIQLKLAPGEWVEPAQITESKHNGADSDSKGLGLSVHSLSQESAKQSGVALTDGVMVMSVEKGTPADLKGFKPGDVITAVNQQPVTNPKQFREVLKKADVKKGVIVNFVSGNTARFEVLKVGED